MLNNGLFYIPLLYSNEPVLALFSLNLCQDMKSLRDNLRLKSFFGRFLFDDQGFLDYLDQHQFA